MSYLLAFAGFCALIVLHELGHFAAAKAVGMRVERFALFFPPIIAKVRRGETEYGIGAVPLGGYVRITGMNPHEELAPEVAHRAYYRQAVWKRIVVIAAGPAMNLLIAFLIGWALIASQGVTRVTVEVGEVERGAAAAAVLQPGDRIVSIDGRPGYAPDLSDDEVERRLVALRRSVDGHGCAGPPAEGCRGTTPATVVFERDGARRTERITPRYDAQRKQMRLGLAYGTEQRSVGAGEAATLTARGMWRVTELTVSSITKLFYDEQARKEVSGVVGSYEATRQSFEFDTTRALNVLAIISLSLAVVNLFPFLPLDGGHIFWALAEKVRGRPIPFSVMERASVVGFLLVAFLFVIGLSNDIGRLSGDGFDVR